MDESTARYGWSSNFPVFRSTAPPTIYASLQKLVQDASDEQIRAWRDSVPPLQREASEVLDAYVSAVSFAFIDHVRSACVPGTRLPLKPKLDPPGKRSSDDQAPLAEPKKVRFQSPAAIDPRSLAPVPIARLASSMRFHSLPLPASWLVLPETL